MPEITFNQLAENAPFEDRIARVNEIFKDCNAIVFFGGAGVSTASGIPDFRGKNGLYSKPDPEFIHYQPEYLLSDDCLRDNTQVFFDFYRKNLDTRKYEPNVVHKKMAELEAKGKALGVITQNIDGLHEAAGTKNIVKLHGTADKCHCAKCGKEFPVDFVMNIKEVPRCRCGGVVRPDIVLYGEMLPAGAMDKAYQMIGNADCLVICGTSLALPHIQALIDSFIGEYMIIVNASPTKFDAYADVVFREDLAEVFARIEVE